MRRRQKKNNSEKRNIGFDSFKKRSRKNIFRQGVDVFFDDDCFIIRVPHKDPDFHDWALLFDGENYFDTYYVYTNKFTTKENVISKIEYYYPENFGFIEGGETLRSLDSAFYAPLGLAPTADKELIDYAIKYNKEKFKNNPIVLKKIEDCAKKIYILRNFDKQ